MSVLGKCFGIGLVIVASVATSKSYSGPVSFAGIPWEANGCAALVEDTLRLVPLQLSDCANPVEGLHHSNRNRQGSAFMKRRFRFVERASYSIHFSFGGLQSDGLALIFQDDSRGFNAIGGGGGNLGYSGDMVDILQSVIVEFDGFQNTWDPSHNHIGLNVNALKTSIVSSASPFDFETNFSKYVWVDYDGYRNIIDVFISDNAIKPVNSTLSKEINISSVVGDSGYIGFSSATGARFDNVDIESFSMSFTRVSEPGMSSSLLIGFGITYLTMFRPSRSRGSNLPPSA